MGGPPAGVLLGIPSLHARRPDVLEIALRKGRRPQVEAYWDGCTYVL
jgi:hypothetical protein